MTDLERHGTHNQKSHGNRLSRPDNVAGKTGLAKLAEQNRVGTSDIRQDDEVTVSKGPAGYSRSPHLGKTGTVVSSDGSHHIVEFDDGSGQHQIHQSELKVKRTRHDAGLERERRAKLDAEVKAIQDRADARRKAPPIQEYVPAISVKVNDTVKAGFSEGKVWRLERKNGIDGAIVKIPGEHYTRWIPLSQLQKRKGG